MVEQRYQTPPEAEFHPEKITSGDFKGKDFLSIEQLDRKSLETLFRYVPLVEDLCIHSKKSDILAGIAVSIWFDEKSYSTRTYMSTIEGIGQLGGIVVEKPQNSSDLKGESFGDSILIMEMNSDVIAMRSSISGAISEAAKIAKKVPVVNLGDARNGHPTQAGGDLYTTNKRCGLDNLTVVVMIDPKHSRTIQSYLDGLCLGNNNIVYSLAQDELQFTKEQLEKYRNRGLTINTIKDLYEMPKHYNVVYTNRPQVERWDDELKPERDRLMSPYIVNNEFLNKHGCDEMIILDPLPRVGEIAEEVDNDPRALYLGEQVRYVAYTRTAIFPLVTGRINPNVIEYQR